MTSVRLESAAFGLESSTLHSNTELLRSQIIYYGHTSQLIVTGNVYLLFGRWLRVVYSASRPAFNHQSGSFKAHSETFCECHARVI